MSNIFSAFNKYKYLLLIILLAVGLRSVFIDWPFYTVEEARVSFRGYNLSHYGVDELGRKIPYVFNSLEGYKLPLTSYIASLGILIFGKNEYGIRIPFIILGVLLVFFTYKASFVFSKKREYALLSALILSFSPTLIFLSRVPNEIIILANLLLILFILLTRVKVNVLYIGVVVFLAVLTSQKAWFVLLPFIIFTLQIYNNDLNKTTKRNIYLLALFETALILIFFLNIPQGIRDLMEGNFTLTSDPTIKNGIDTLRGQAVIQGVPPFVAKILFNKLHYIFSSILNWLSAIQLNTFFGQFENNSKLAFYNMGVWTRITIIPFAWAAYLLIRRPEMKLRYLGWMGLLLTFPILFTYPLPPKQYIILFIPFMAFLISYGLMKMSVKLRVALILLILVELSINMLVSSYKDSKIGDIRPLWIKPLVSDINSVNNSEFIGVSDNIVEDITPYILLFGKERKISDPQNLDFPYKFRQPRLDNIIYIGSENEIYICSDKEQTDKRVKKVFLSERDLEKFTEPVLKTEKTYYDQLGKEVAFLVPGKLCLR